MLEQNLKQILLKHGARRFAILYLGADAMLRNAGGSRNRFLWRKDI